MDRIYSFHIVNWGSMLNYYIENSIFYQNIEEILNQYPAQTNFYDIIPELRLQILQKTFLRYIELIINNVEFYKFDAKKENLIRIDDDNKKPKNFIDVKDIIKIKAYKEHSSYVFCGDYIIHWTIDTNYENPRNINYINYAMPPSIIASVPQTIYYSNEYDKRLLMDDLLYIINIFEITLKNNDKYLFIDFNDSIFLNFIINYINEDSVIDINIEDLMVEFNYYYKNANRLMCLDYDINNKFIKYYE